MASPSLLHFSMIPLDPAKVDGLGLRGVFIQQAVTEEVLTEYRASSAGCRSCAVTRS